MDTQNTKNTQNVLNTILDFKVYKKTIKSNIKKNINNIINLTDNFLANYKKYKKESDPKLKKELKEQAHEYMKLIHNSFSDIEISLRDFKEIAEKNSIDLIEEDIPEFEDEIQMTKEEYQKYKKENDFDEQRMIIWLKLFKKKINYLIKIIQDDLDKNKKVEDKIKIINQFYRQIFVAYKVVLNDAFMTGATENKIKIT